MNILDVKNLSLSFNTEAGFKQALFDVSFSVEKGRTLALVGESGCGKTISALSVLRLLPKTAKITSGEIYLREQETGSREQLINLLNLSESDMQKIRGAKIALIPQDPMTSLNPLYTIENQLLEVIEKHQKLKGSKARQKAIEALEAVQIPCAKERLKSYPHEFSGGMKQRAIIAMALACQAGLIIADEPTTALDVTIQAQIMKLLDEIKKKFNTSIILITHDLALVEEVSDKICVMYAGRIVEHAATKEFFQNPKHPYSKALLKSVPSKKGEKLAIITGQPPSIRQDISGCKFHPRCEFVIPVCPESVPPLKEVSTEHFCACRLY